MRMILKSDLPYSDRIGIAPLIRAAMQGHDIGALRADLMARGDQPGAGMDLAVVEQVLGNRELGLQIQQAALGLSQCYRPSGAPVAPRLRVLALAAPLDIGGNTPIEFLVQGQDVELKVLYVLSGRPIEHLVPEHDIAIVTIPDDDQAAPSLETLRRLADAWPRPILNHPARIALTDRDRLFTVLQTVPNLQINWTSRLSRAALESAAVDGSSTLTAPFPFIVRPVGSHAGKGLARMDAPSDVAAYLAGQGGDAFFLSPFTDYSNADGLFRKYRIAFVDGKPFACHMAISDKWAIWYLNANMHLSSEKRLEEERFITRFDSEFGARHDAALSEIARRLDLDYFQIDCAETKDGKLLVFEAGIAMIVHDMDPPALYPYKLPQAQKIFAAFGAMLDKHVSGSTIERR